MNILGQPVPVVFRYIGTVTNANTTVHTVNSKARFAKAKAYIKSPNSTTIQGQITVGGTVMTGSTTSSNPGSAHVGGSAAATASANANDKKFAGEYFAKPGEAIALGTSGADTMYYTLEVEEYF